MADAINIGGIVADLQIDSGHLERGLAGGRKALDAIAREVQQLQADFQRGTITLNDYNARLLVLVNTEHQLTAAMRAAYGAAHQLHTGLEIVNASANKMGGAFGNLGSAMMQFSYMVDDVQFGFQAIVNNVGPLVLGLTGGNAAIAGSAQIAAVGVYQLYKHWDELMDLMGLGVVRSEAEEMEELANKTHRTAEETEKLNRYKKEQLEIQKMLAGQSDEEKATAKAVQDAYDEAGPGKVAGALAAQMRGELTPEQEAQIARLGHGNDLQASRPQEELREKFEKELDDEAARKATELMQKAKRHGPEGETALKEIITKVDRVPGAVNPGGLDALIRATPEERARQASLEAQGRANSERWKEEKEARDKAQKKAAAEEEKQVAERAKGFMGGQAGIDALKGPLPVEVVESELRRSGDTAEDARRLAPKVSAKVEEEAEEKIRRHGLSQGLEHDAARQDLIRDAEEEQQRKTEQRERRDAKRAELALPGMRGQVERSLALGRIQGLNPERQGISLGAQIAAVLKERGNVDPETAKIQAAALVKESQGKVDERIRSTPFEAPEAQPEKRRQSEVFDAVDLSAKIQSAIGGEDDRKKMVTLTEKVVEYLEKIAGKESGGGGNPFAGWEGV